MINKIDKELQRIKEVKCEIEYGMIDAPKGKLRCTTCKGYYQYYCGKSYIGLKDRTIASKLANREYYDALQKELRVYEKLLLKLRTFYENRCLERVYQKLHPARKILVTPLYRPIEEIIEGFECVEHIGKGFAETDNTSYYTIKGERVRSKSEKIIADELYRYAIPYKYELPIELQAWNKKIEVYPDFTVLNKRTGKRWILEHFGMMDNLSYYESALQKLNTYEKNEILLGRDLIVLHETSTCPLDTKILGKYIHEYLM